MSKDEGMKIKIEDADEIAQESAEADAEAKSSETVDTKVPEGSGEEAEETEEGSEEEAEKASGEEAGEEDAGAGDGEEASDAKDGKKRFGRKNKKDPKDEKIEALEDRVKRQMAEFENFRKRTDKEKSQMFDMGAKSVIEKILPVIDNFERGLENVPEGCDEAFVDGMQKIYKQFTAELDKLGVKPIEALGQTFDPNIHNAVMQVESSEYESGVVAQELQKGYMYHETLVRPSMVGVAQ